MTSDPGEFYPEQMDEDQIREEQERLVAEEQERKAALLADLARVVEEKFDTRRKGRSSKERQWNEAISLYYGSAINGNSKGSTSDRPFASELQSSRPDYNIVRTKCDIATAQLIAMQFAGGDKNWDLLPATGTDSSTAQAMEDQISEQLGECKYAKESRRAIEDRVLFGSAIMKGPVNTNRTNTQYVPDETGTWQTNLSSNKAPSYVRVNPWYAFPDDSTNDPASMEDFIEIHPMTRTELSKYTKHDGFFQETLLELLKEDPKDYSVSVFDQLKSNSGASSVEQIKNKYIVIEYHGPVTSEQLDALNIVPAYESPDGNTYYGEVWVCQGRVLRVELSNIENFEIPYTICPYKEDPASVLGFGMPMFIKDQQRVITQCWHMVLDNTSASSGPQVVMQRDLIEPDDNEWELRPRKKWFLTDMSARITDAFQFFNVPNMSGSIMEVLNAAKMFADEESGVPTFTPNLSSAQVGTDTATGLGLLQQAGTILSDLSNEAWDDLMTERHIARMVAWNIQYNPDNTIKGNFKVDVKASSDYRNKQIYIRDMEKLSLESSQNPELGKHIDMNELARARLSMMQLPSSSIVLDAATVAEREQAAAENQQPNADVLKYNVETERLKIEKDRLMLDAARLQFDQEQGQKREEMEFEERRGNTFARIAEAEGSVLKSQNEKDIAMMNLAQKDEALRSRIGADLEIARQRNETQAYLKGLEDTRKTRDQLLTSQELDMKARFGTGI